MKVAKAIKADPLPEMRDRCARRERESKTGCSMRRPSVRTKAAQVGEKNCCRQLPPK